MKGKRPVNRRLKGAEFHALRVGREIERNPKRFEKKLSQLGVVGPAMTQNRNYSAYNNFFKNALGEDLVDALSKIARGRKTPLRILDDGAGKGIFLRELKEKLKEKKIESHTTALSLPEKDKEGNAVNDLISLEKKREIDEVVLGPAENFIPEKPFDAIISLFGSIHYTLSSLRKEHLLKFAYSLKKGGLMLIGFEPLEEPFSMSMKKGIERSFAKRGFEAEFFLTKDSILPYWILFVKRR